jgi:hypothetical protein
MTRILLPALLLLSVCCSGQRTVTMNRLWEEPQVHVAFQGYVISFRIKDIDNALLLLAETGDSTYGLSSSLDTSGWYELELYPAIKNQYRSRLEPLLQRGVGAFLILSGRAEIRNPKHKKVPTVTADITDGTRDEPTMLVNFYDPKTNRLLFMGRLATEMYNKDLGLD